jgi:hypothetical protein
MSKIINFIAQDEHVWNVRPKPFPAAKGLPNWWKEMDINSIEKFDLAPFSTVTVKRCVPTIDMLTSGYYVPLWSDIYVKQESSGPVIKWTTKVSVLEAWHPTQVANFKFLEGFSKIVFKNLHGWTIKTPPGWSCIFLHPQAYQDLPFQTISGIVDTDVYDGEINVPFVVKDNFEGIINRNTPMFQVIPFKREKWDSRFTVKEPNEHFYDSEKLYSKINRAYYSLIKDKKIYR